MGTRNTVGHRHRMIGDGGGEIQTQEEHKNELEQMAEDRLEIETKLEERAEELDSIGTFGEAFCTGFEKTEYGGVEFDFEFPDRTTGTKQFSIEAEGGSLQQFLEKFGADSVTDMIGAKHACIKDSGGWRLCKKPNVRPWTACQWVSQDGTLHQFNWVIVASYIVFEVAAFWLRLAFGGMSGMAEILAAIGIVLFILGGFVGFVGLMATAEGDIQWY